VNSADIVWTGVVIIGGLLITAGSFGKKLSATEGSILVKCGIIVTLGGFLYQVYWELLHQTVAPAITWNLTSKVGIGCITALVVVPMFIRPGILRGWVHEIYEFMRNGESVSKKGEKSRE